MHRQPLPLVRLFRTLSRPVIAPHLDSTAGPPSCQPPKWGKPHRLDRLAEVGTGGWHQASDGQVLGERAEPPLGAAIVFVGH